MPPPRPFGRPLPRSLSPAVLLRLAGLSRSRSCPELVELGVDAWLTRFSGARGPARPPGRSAGRAPRSACGAGRRRRQAHLRRAASRLRYATRSRSIAVSEKTSACNLRTTVSTSGVSRYAVAMASRPVRRRCNGDNDKQSIPVPLSGRCRTAAHRAVAAIPAT